MFNVRQFIKKLTGKTPLKQVRKNPEFFQIDSSAIILDSVRFDFRVERSHQEKSIIIGKDSMVGCSFHFESSKGVIKIGERTFINGSTSLISRSSIEIGNDVTIGWGCYIYDHDSHSLNWKDRCEDIEKQTIDYHNGRNMVYSKNWDVVSTKPIKICDKAWIGFDAVILKGVTIGEGAIVGAKSVVTKNVDPWTVVAGNPAKIVKTLVASELENEEKA